MVRTEKKRKFILLGAGDSAQVRFPGLRGDTYARSLKAGVSENILPFRYTSPYATIRCQYAAMGAIKYREQCRMTRRRRGCDWEHDAYPRVPRAPTVVECSQNGQGIHQHRQHLSKVNKRYNILSVLKPRGRLTMSVRSSSPHVASFAFRQILTSSCTACTHPSN